MSQLAPCPHCHRHLRITETVCPFCGGQVADSLESKARRPISTFGLSRAGILALGATMAVASGALLEGCGDEPDDEDDSNNAVPIYGAPVQSDAGVSDSGVPHDAGTVAPIYGAPLQPKDAGPGTVVPVYGAPLQPRDAGPLDAGNSDAGSSDAGKSDAGKPDAGKPDAGREDGGRLVPVYGAPVPLYGAPVQPDNLGNKP